MDLHATLVIDKQQAGAWQAAQQSPFKPSIVGAAIGAAVDVFIDSTGRLPIVENVHVNYEGAEFESANVELTLRVPTPRRNDGAEAYRAWTLLSGTE